MPAHSLHRHRRYPTPDSVYFTINQDNEIMPASFPAFCEFNSIFSSFLSILHFIFIMIIPFYVVYILRSTLKASIYFTM
jgi:hypothetical protein